MGTDLAEALEDEQPETEQELEATEVQEIEQVAEETGEKEQESTPEPEKTVPLSALEDERRKRQDLSKRLEALEQPKAEPEEPKDLWEDTQGWQDQFGNQVVQTAVDKARMDSRLDTSEMMVRQSNPDFDAMKAKFLEMAEANPVLGQKALADPHPWNYAYNAAKNAGEMEAMGATSIEEVREQVRKEMAEEAAESAGLKLPPTTAQARNTGSRSNPTWSGPTSLGSILD